MNPKLFHSVLLVVFTFHWITATASNNLIHETCRKCAQNDPNIAYNFCATSLEAHPGSHCADLGELGIISLKLTKQNVTDTKKYINGLLKNKKLDPDSTACLKDCRLLYSDAISTLKQAIKDYKSKHYADANIQVSSVIDASTTCEDGFQEKSLISPLKTRNNNTFQLSAIALSIINMIS